MSIEHELRAGTTPPGKVCERHLDDLILLRTTRSFRCVCSVNGKRIQTVERGSSTGAVVLELMNRHGSFLGMCSVRVEK